MKKLLFKQNSDTPHWVGDGFPVRSIFTYQDRAEHLSPFLLMDYAGPAEFQPTGKKRGVGEHPHRGFETVTVVYSGEVEHRDSAGGGGRIGPGDVQWMTAGSGLVHEEMHGDDFSKKGGLFEMIQLWVNLPAKDKMTRPRYQGLTASEIPSVDLGNGAGTLRVIAGDYRHHRGPAKTFTPMNMWDVQVGAQNQVDFELPEGHNTLVFVLSGKVRLGSGEVIESAELAVFDREGKSLSMTAEVDAKILILTGEPINEPVIGYGPFVMNTPAEIQQAFVDFNTGKMGQLPTGH